MKHFFKIIFISLLFVGCTDDCDDMVAATGPVGFEFEVVKASTHENVFNLGLYTEGQIHITDQNGEPVEFHFIGENEVNLIRINLGWETKTDVYTVTIGDDIEFQLIFSLKEETGKCHTITKLTELEIQGAAHESVDGSPMQILVP